MTDGTLDLALTVLDRQLVDSDGRNCGRVDDIELSGGLGQPLMIDALLVGPGAWSGRMRSPVGRLLSRLGRHRVSRVPWSDVREVTHVVKLRGRAVDWGLGRGDTRVHEWMRKAPRA
jgi:sporulation protein YlmC with PRC-barrel domain